MHSVTDRQTDRGQDYANSRSYCVAVRSAKNSFTFVMLIIDRNTCILKIMTPTMLFLKFFLRYIANSVSANNMVRAVNNVLITNYDLFSLIIVISTLFKCICLAHLNINCLDTLCFIQNFILISTDNSSSLKSKHEMLWLQ